MTDQPFISNEESRNPVKRYPYYNKSIYNTNPEKGNRFSMQRAFNYILLTNSKMRRLENLHKKDFGKLMRSSARKEARLLNFSSIREWINQSSKICRWRVNEMKQVTVCKVCKLLLKTTVSSLLYICEPCMVVYKMSS